MHDQEETNLIECYLKELMNNVTFRTQDSCSLLQEANTADFTRQSRSLTERRRSSLAPEHRHSRYKSFSFDHLSSLVQDLFVAGTETISNTLDWAILYATFFPEMQRQIQKEIDHVLGKEKLPTESDRFKRHFLLFFSRHTLLFQAYNTDMRCTLKTQSVYILRISSSSSTK